MKSSLIAMAALVLAGLGTAGNVAASESETLPSKVVNFSDLNLHSPAGVKVLYQRIVRAAGSVCRQQMGVYPLIIPTEIKACSNESVDRAIAQVGLPALSEMHFAKTGRGNKDVQVANKD